MPRKIHVGLLNIMPDAEDYEQLIRGALDEHLDAIDIHPIRLLTHAYSEKPLQSTRYRGFAETLVTARLDLLIITGAPVEHLDYEKVSYWPELRQIIHAARANIRSTVGICFGGLAIAKCLGINKCVIDGKAFGLYRLRLADSRNIYADSAGRDIHMPFSTRALLDPAEVRRELDRGSIYRIAHSNEMDAVLETDDRRFLMILGHPEYEAATLRNEWVRDSVRGIPYVQKFTEEYFNVLTSQMPSRKDSVLAIWLSSHIAAIRQDSFASEIVA